jgi:molybdopterin-guanine dinucleotide biosynthesis protein A
VNPVGVILAGGTGRRIGGEKALVALDGKPLLLYPVEAMSAVLDDVAIVCKQHTPLPDLGPGIEIWCEAEPEHHPLVGIVAALRRTAEQGRSILVCAGDMPLVTADVLRALLDAPEAPAVVARADGRLQPLLARYAPDALPGFEAMEPGEPATRVVERMGPLIVDVPARAAFNVNVPEDLLLAERERVRGDA